MPIRNAQYLIVAIVCTMLFTIKEHDKETIHNSIRYSSNKIVGERRIVISFKTDRNYLLNAEKEKNKKYD
ncbi:hypothetical protein [Candidatus Nitrosocosmicus arcticus]|uniref:hypothetical protein n=1 Tax=Candidatus Nitrosocosmicus arcticus TaxID=2035267 RepID=UPI0011A1A285|nr:hypothetical protein [Candidatus Nitrosocosmicus arcticus]